MKILFFAPHSALWVHAFPEALLAEALKQSGHDIHYLTCGRLLASSCIPMHSSGLKHDAGTAEKQRVCQNCEKRDELIRTSFNFSGARLSELARTEDERFADEIIGDLDAKQLIALKKDGVPFGRLALYEFMLRNKRMDLELDDDVIDEYRKGLRNVLLVWQAAGRWLIQNKPDCLFVYNSLYSINAVVCRLARKAGIPVYFLHAGGNLSGRLQTLMMGRDDTISFMYRLVDSWPRFAAVPATSKFLSAVTDHFLELMRGRNAFAYSQARSNVPFSARARWNIPADAKILVAAMSSNDEIIAADVVGALPIRTPPLFPTQVEWIASLFDFVAKRQDVFLIVRVHPREFPNRRESRLSQHAMLLQQVLSKLPHNVAVNWPSDQISLYDLADETGVFLTGWSSVGREMPLLGIPVVTYAPYIMGYPTDLNYSASDTAGYFDAVERALADGWSFERARTAYRWGVMEFHHALLHIGDSYQQREDVDYSKVPLVHRAINKSRRFLDPEFTLKDDCRRRASRLAAGDTIVRIIEQRAESVLDLLDPATIEQGTPDQETEALHHELGRLANALYPSKEARSESRLHQLLTGNVAHAAHGIS